MQKLEKIKLTKSDKKVIYAIGCLTLQERKKATKTSHAKIAEFCTCSEKTVQRTVIKLEKAELITRGKPKWKHSPWFINISSDFYQEVKVIFHEQKKLSTRIENVHTGETKCINNSNSCSQGFSNSKITKTEIDNSKVQFFISNEILEINLHDLDNSIGLSYTDLELIKRKTGWRICDIQTSIENFAIALETNSFIPTKIPPRNAFIAILTGSNGKRAPSLFNKPQALINAEMDAKKAIETEVIITLEDENTNTENSLKKECMENNWLSISDEQKSAYTEQFSSIHEAIEKAYNDKIQLELTSLSMNLDKQENFSTRLKPTDLSDYWATIKARAESSKKNKEIKSSFLNENNELRELMALVKQGAYSL